MTYRVVTEPAAEPITLTEAKAHLRVDHTLDDTLITALIVVARKYAEKYTRRAFIQQTMELTLPCFTDTVIQLPCPPLQSITHVKYIDADGVLQTVDSADYQADTYRSPGLIKPAYLESWPSLTRNDFNMVQIRYVAGYPTSGSPISDIDYAANVPEPIKQWIKIRVATLYEFREAIVTGAIVATLQYSFIDGMLDEYMVDIF